MSVPDSRALLNPPSTCDSIQYWEGVSANIDGMLGGVSAIGAFACVNKVDLQGSRSFLAKLGIGLKGDRRCVRSILEFGAGIGRVTEGLLLPIAEQVDIVEPVAKFTVALQGRSRVRHVLNVRLEEWCPSGEFKYDLIWIQWCLCYATDDQLVEHLQRCKAVLEPEGGVIVVKENLSTGRTDFFDAADSSVTREDTKMQSLFKQAGLRIIHAEIQKGFPKSFPRKLLPVKMYALKPV